jgi:hypothetical protein
MIKVDLKSRKVFSDDVEITGVSRIFIYYYGPKEDQKDELWILRVLDNGSLPLNDAFGGKNEFGGEVGPFTQAITFDEFEVIA